MVVEISDGGNPPPPTLTCRSPSPWSTTKSSLWHGLGLFGESYLLFSVGTLRPLWEAIYPSCFDDADNDANNNNNDLQCNRQSHQSMTYSVVLGIMVGMVVLGILANTIGRRRGSIITAMLMAGGACCLTFSSIFLSHAPSILFPFLSLSLFVFGIGVGGEYPLSASSASERQMAVAAEERQRRHQHLRLRGITHEAFDNHAEKVLTPRQSNTTSRARMNESNNCAGKREPLILVGGENETNVKQSSWQTLQLQPQSKQQLRQQQKLQDIASFGCETDIVTLPPAQSSTPIHISGGTHADDYFFPTTSSILYDDCKSAHSLASTNSNAHIYRGREMLLTFSMQGMGIFVNSMLLALLLLVTKRTVKDGDNVEAEQDRYYFDTFYYAHTTLLNIWRATYAIGAAILVYVLASRILWLTESEVWKQEKERSLEQQRQVHHRHEVSTEFQPPKLPPGNDNKQMKREAVEDNPKNEEPVLSPTMSSLTLKSDFDLLGSTNLDGCGFVPEVRTMEDGDNDERGDNRNSWSTPSSHVKLLFRHYGVRLFGTSMIWLLWDIAYYGNKLFQSSVLLALLGDDVSLVSISSGKLIHGSGDESKLSDDDATSHAELTHFPRFLWQLLQSTHLLH